MSDTGVTGDSGVIVSRNLGGIIANVTVSERHHDRLEITRHPVEIGASITDHAYKHPAEVTVSVGWSDANGVDLKAIYQKLLVLQASREPFAVVTGKRNYKNMLFDSLALDTDEKTEHALMITADIHEIIMVETVTTSTVADGSSSQSGDQSDGADTGRTQQQGTGQLNQGLNFNSDAARRAGVIIETPA